MHCHVQFPSGYRQIAKCKWELPLAYLGAWPCYVPLVLFPYGTINKPTVPRQRTSENEIGQGGVNLEHRALPLFATCSQLGVAILNFLGRHSPGKMQGLVRVDLWLWQWKWFNKRCHFQCCISNFSVWTNQSRSRCAQCDWSDWQTGTLPILFTTQ